MSTTLVKNGTVVTAGDRYDADIYIDKGRITLIGQGLNLPADTVVDASGKLVMPGGIDVHTHLDMPFGGTTSADDFESGTIAAAHGGTTTVVDFAIQNFGEGLFPAFEGWMKKAEGRSVIDYAFHMIVRELTDQVSGDMDKLTKHEGVTSFKLFMAYPGVFQVDDATIFRALLKTKENGGLVCMHAENGGRHRHAGEGGAAQGPDRAQVPRPHPAHARGGRGHRPRHRAGRDGGRAHLHRAPLLLGRAGEGEAGARHGPARLRRDLPAVPLPLLRGLRAAGLRGREVRDVAAPAREVEPGRALEGARQERPPGRLHRPLPVLHERAAAEAARQGRLLEDPQRRARASRRA